MKRAHPEEGGSPQGGLGVEDGAPALDDIVGSSPAMRALREAIARVARSERPVLVTGPTGAGKELVVRALHALGPTRGAPLIDVNCGAVPEALFESQLFGHERGTFTGADRRHDGLFSLVGRGTLFLDEIGELPPSLQPKLLRVLETQTFRPVGAPTCLRFRGRVVAATHADLEARARAGTFRTDLLFRLNVLELRIPPLDDRRADIPELVARFCRELPRPPTLTDGAMAALAARRWPGNVRQLRNAVDRLAVLSPEGPLSANAIRDILGDEAHASARPDDPLLSLVELLLERDAPDKLRLVENALVRAALRRCDGNKTAAARLLGVHRRVVERRVRAWEAAGEDAELTHAAE